jgi:23S rRNA pseudouridine1911/1915/1917 synthase
LNQGFTYTEIIEGRGAGQCLLDYLASRYTHSSRETWLSRIQDGLVLLEAQLARAEAVLRQGQSLSWTRPPWEEPDVPLAYAVLFRNADLLAVAKPSGLPTLPGGGYFEHTLLSLVRRQYPGASPIHRLGRGTSGVVLFGRTPDATSALSGSMRAHGMGKLYRALVAGHPAQDAFSIEVPIGPIPHPTLGTVHGANPRGKPARSHVEVLERRSDCTLVQVRIETGRPHQIRIHMAAAGHPLVGDPLYASGGGLCGEGRALPGDEGYLLHAWKLSLDHPRTGRRLEVICCPPEGLRMGTERP